MHAAKILPPLGTPAEELLADLDDDPDVPRHVAIGIVVQVIEPAVHEEVADEDRLRARDEAVQTATLARVGDHAVGVYLVLALIARVPGDVRREPGAIAVPRVAVPLRVERRLREHRRAPAKLVDTLTHERERSVHRIAPRRRTEDHRSTGRNSSHPPPPV